LWLCANYAFGISRLVLCSSSSHQNKISWQIGIDLIGIDLNDIKCKVRFDILLLEKLTDWISE